MISSLGITSTIELGLHNGHATGITDSRKYWMLEVIKAVIPVGKALGRMEERDEIIRHA
jgi:hypothetical protein